MKILFIRHGQSLNNLYDTTKGLSFDKYEEMYLYDPKLSDLGRKQYELVAKYLQNENFHIEKVFCSAMIRALESAEIIQKSLFLKDFEVMADLCEEGGLMLKNKTFQGINSEKLIKDFPGFSFNKEEITEKGWFFKEKRENNEELHIRGVKIVDFLQKIALKNKESSGVIIIITHGNFLDKMMKILLEIERKSDFFFEHDNAGISCFETDEKGDLLMNFFNFKGHLEGI